MNDKQLSGMELPEITKKVDDLWGQIKQKRKELQPLLYAAWKLFEGKRGRPEPGTETFSSWLKARGISRKTGYRILDREREVRGELIVSSDTISQLEPVVKMFAGITAIVSNDPDANEPTVPLTARIVEIQAQSPKLTKSVLEQEGEVLAEAIKLLGEQEAAKLRAQTIVMHLPPQLAPFRKKSPQTVKQMQQRHQALIARNRSSSIQEVR